MRKSCIHVMTIAIVVMGSRLMAKQEIPNPTPTPRWLSIVNLDSKAEDLDFEISKVETLLKLAKEKEKQAKIASQRTNQLVLRMAATELDAEETKSALIVSSYFNETSTPSANNPWGYATS
jgi:hypothetical protein